MKNFFFYILTLWLILWFQIAYNHFLGFTAASVQWTLIAVIFFGLTRGPFVGQGVGLVWGLLLDASSLGLMGLHTMLYAIAGYLAGLFRRQLDGGKPWTQSIFTAALSLGFLVIYSGLDRLFSPAPRPWSWAILVQPVINAVMAPIVFIILRRWVETWGVYRVEED